MRGVKKTRIIGGNTYRLMSNPQGTSSQKANNIKTKLKKLGYESVRVLHTKGMYFVYAIKG